MVNVIGEESEVANFLGTRVSAQSNLIYNAVIPISRVHDLFNIVFWFPPSKSEFTDFSTILVLHSHPCRVHPSISNYPTGPYLIARLTYKRRKEFNNSRDKPCFRTRTKYSHLTFSPTGPKNRVKASCCRRLSRPR